MFLRDMQRSSEYSDEDDEMRLIWDTFGLIHGCVEESYALATLARVSCYTASHPLHKGHVLIYVLRCDPYPLGGKSHKHFMQLNSTTSQKLQGKRTKPTTYVRIQSMNAIGCAPQDL